MKKDWICFSATFFVLAANAASKVARTLHSEVVGCMLPFVPEITAYRLGGVMQLMDKLLVFLTLTVSLASPPFGATITGSVKGPDGKPFMGAS